MATTTGQRLAPNTSRDAPSTKYPRNPFDTVFDGENSEDEWWDEDDTDSLSLVKPAHLERTTQWPRASESSGAAASSKPMSRASTRKPDKRYSVHKPTRDKSKGRQKKQNAQAGIKLVTTFSRHQAASPPVQMQPPKTLPHMGLFVDLAALQALTGDSTQSSGKFWKSKSKKSKGMDLMRVPETVPSIPSGSEHDPRSSNLMNVPQRQDQSHLMVSPVRPSEDLSPNDRPIMIGLSIPSSDVSQHSLSPQTASSDTSKIIRSYDRSHQTPDTPTIIITPAQEIYGWSPINTRARPASSIYSQAVNGEEVYNSQDAPPVPKVPSSVLRDEQQRVAAQKSYFSPDSDNGTSWEDDEYSSDHSKSRVMSTCTVFEEDESPIIARTARAVSINGESNANKHASVSTVGTRRRSKGWWNYITTPFLTRSNTFANRSPQDEHPPALPSLAIAAAKAREVERDDRSWEKQFSPLTPETSTTIQSDPWWNVDPKDNKAGGSPVLQETRHKVQESSGSLPIVLSEVAGFGAASTVSSLASDDSPHLNSTRTLDENINERVVPVLSDAPVARPLQSNNPFVQPRMEDLEETSNTRQSNREPVLQHAQIAVLQRAQLPPVHRTQSPSGTPPPPPYSPSPSRNPRYRAVFPPGHVLNIQQPASPGPISPGMQQSMASSGAIPMSTVPLATQDRRPINLNSSYPAELPPRQERMFFTTEHLQSTSKKAKKSEAKRRRHEKEDAIARKAGGWWRGRGCISKKGCYGRKGAEGRKKRRWIWGFILLFLLMLILIIVLATMLPRKSKTSIGPSQWVNLTGFPPIFTGLSTVIGPSNPVAQPGCTAPSTLWSCSLPKEVQASVATNQADQPNFFLHIQWDNSSSANDTFKNVTGNPSLGTRAVGGNAVSAGQFVKGLLLKARQIVTFVPSPTPPSFGDEFFLGNTTDNIVSPNKAGEPTPFFISFLPTSNSTMNKRSLVERQSPDNSSNSFPDVSDLIPPPSLNADGTAQAANLLPLPTQQPIRLYDRGLPTEHYGFYTYFDRSIFLKSINDTVPDDENGGARESEAAFRCTWAQTRFLVQMWTRMNTTARLLNSTHTISKDPAHDFSQPGSFPYPITISIDRHGGDPKAKALYCYPMDDHEGIAKGTGNIHPEARDFGGTLINPASLLFDSSQPPDPNLGGFDGGSGGCGCAWQNWQGVVGG